YSYCNFEKSYRIYIVNNVTFCRDVGAYYDDKDIQFAANPFYFFSSLTLLCPSLVTTLLLGAATDYWSIKIPLIIPYIGCILGTINYVLSVVFHSYFSLISTTGKQLVTVIREFYRVLTKSRPFRLILALNLLAFGVEMLIFSGLSDIQYSYLRYKLQWGDKKYGWFSGLSYGITTAAVLFLYPVLRMKWMSDGMLATLGLFFKMISLFMFAFVQNEAMAYSIAGVVMFNRFVSTGFRAFISSLIDMQEQGKIFSVISLLEGITTLVATSIYNNLYPKTLTFFPGLLYLISAALLLVPLSIVSTSDFVVRSRRPEVSEGILNSRNDVIDEVSDSN
ncbi:hypothetical protein CAEBREN_23965, partial [Caenorhabditis brenneri]